MSDERIFRSGQKPPAQSKQSALPKQERPVPDLQIPQQERQVPDLKIDKSKSGEEDLIERESSYGFVVHAVRTVGIVFIGLFIFGYICYGWSQEAKNVLIFGLGVLTIAVLAYKYPIYRAKYQIRFHQTKDPRTTPAMRAVLQIWLNENLPAQIDLDPGCVPPLIEKMYAWLLALATKYPHYPADRLHRRFMAAWAQFFVDGKNAKGPALP